MKIVQQGNHTIETPCHQLLDYEEHNDCCDIVLDGYYVLSAVANPVLPRPRRTYVVAVLNIKEAPEAVFCKSSCSKSTLLGHVHRHHSVDDCESPIEGELRNLRGLQLSVCTPKLDDRLVFLRRKPVRPYTIVSCPFDWVVHWLGVFQVDRLGNDRVLRRFRGVGT